MYAVCVCLCVLLLVYVLSAHNCIDTEKLQSSMPFRHQLGLLAEADYGGVH
jgi:hypothetical protein